MKKILIIVFVVVLLYFAYGRYSQNELADIYRTSWQLLGSDGETSKTYRGVKFTNSIDNQYPEVTFISNIDLDKQPDKESIESARAESKSRSCIFLDDTRLKEDSNYRKAVIRVIEEDNIAVSYVFKQNNKEFFSSRQLLKECPNFFTVKAY